jgi:NAD(P)-dependent dehydrogenase (short-subunit alcohol dehydrogenase family)
MLRLDNKVVLVTGAASGIGACIAERFLVAGASVVIFDIDANGARQTADRLKSFGPVIAIEGDVSCEENARAAVEQTSERFGALDVLINNAAIEIVGQVVDMSSGDWDRVLAVNLKSAFLFAKYAIPKMRKRGGVILNISSIDAVVAYPGYAAYDASKAGLLALTKTLAVDHGRDGIRVNAICPGYTDTPLLREYFRRSPDGERQRVSALTPSGRIGLPLDVAEAALFLASDSASFITGAYLLVDGGLTVVGH